MTRRTFNQSWADWQATHPTLAILRQLSGKDDVSNIGTDAAFDDATPPDEGEDCSDLG